MEGKTAFISGAGRNNGKAIALKFAKEGADLILVSRSLSEELNDVAAQCEKLGVKALPLLGDMTNAADVDKTVKAGLERFGKIDVLVNVIGMRPHKPIFDFTYEEWLEVFAVNCHSLFHLARAIAPGMIERKTGGSIIALGGMAAMRPQPLGALVVSSKHAQYGLIKSLALDLGPYGIRANLLNPGYTANVRRNPEWYKHLGGEPSTDAELAVTPLRRVATNDEIANVALFLASDQSSYVTGDRILCVGGRYI
ncbi:MAG: SDR family oxidoreductase [Rhizobiaceae bacterium]|nr:SDR family oxidoreductase [Rhizobiaceae bacterium]